MDVAVSNGGDNTVYVLLGNGDGTFRVPEILYTQGQSPTWITAVSLRNNGILDLAVTEGDSGSVEIFLGNGDGTFAQGVEVPVANTPTFVLAADVNNDGNQDLVVGLTVDAGATQPQFEVLLGNGAGSFSGTLFPPPITSIDSPIPTGWISSGDLNKDGFTDFVTTITGGQAFTYMNQAGSSFVKSAPFGPSDGTMVVGLGDMDEDGCLDAVELGGAGTVTVAKGTCDGNFVQGTPELAGDLEPAIHIVDVDGDGHLDVVASAYDFEVDTIGAGNEGGYLVSVLKGDGKGNLSPPRLYRGGTDASSLVVADFTGDSKPEILTIDSSENRASLFLNDGSGNFDGPQGETIGLLPGSFNITNDVFPIKSADLNGDGKPDLFLVEPEESGPQLTTMLNDGTGKFLPSIRSPIAAGPINPFPEYLADTFRSSGMVDIIYVTKFFSANNVVAYLPGNGNGTFGAAVTLATLPDPRKVVAADFNGDGNKDFAVVGLDAGGSNWEIDVFLGHGDGTFTELPSQTFPIQNAGSIQQLFALDLNHDGKIDLLIGNNDNGGLTTSGDDLIEALGNGDGTFQAPKTLIPHFGAVAVADVNHDGFPDLIQGRDPSQNITTQFFTPAVTVYLGTTSGTFVQQPSYDLDGVEVATEAPVLVGDFNGDGNVDIAVRHLMTEFGPLVEPRLTVLQGVGDATFTVAGHEFQLQGTSDPIIGADFDGDGTTDLVEFVGYTYSFHTINAAPAPSLDIALDSSPVIGTTGTAAVTLYLPAVVAETVSLSASDPAIQFPPSLTFAPGQQRQNFTFTLGTGFDTTHVFALYATFGGETAVAFGSKPNPNTTTGVAASLDVTSAAVTPGETVTLHFTLASESGYQGAFSSFGCSGLPSGTACSFSASSMSILPGGREEVNLSITTSSSTPFGKYPIQVTATDGFFNAVVGLQLGIGSFSLSISPATIVVGPTGTADPVVTATSTNGLSESIALTCTGLPPNSGCGQDGNLSANGGATGLSVGSNMLLPNDYPFQVVGAANIASQIIPAILRVGDFTASLDKTSATLSAGQSTTFNITVSSVNHYASTITVTCQLPVTFLSCAASPSSVSLSGGQITTVQLNVAASQSASVFPRHPGGHAIHLPPVFCLVLLPLLLLIPRRAKVLRIATLVLVLGAIIACGGGPNGSTGGNPPPPPQPQPQIVNITVIASASSTPADLNNQKILGPIQITVQ